MIVLPGMGYPLNRVQLLKENKASKGKPKR